MSQIDVLIAEHCPNGVQHVAIGDIARTVAGLSGKTKSDFTDGNSRFASYKNIFANPSLNLVSEDFVKVGPGEKQNALRRGDVLITGSSESVEEVGMSAVVTSEPTEPIYVNSFCFIVRFHDPTMFDPDFAKHLFRSLNIRKQIQKCGSGVTRINISKPRFLKVMIPVPPLEVQREIVRILDTFSKMEAELEAELDARKQQYDYYLRKLTDPSEIDGRIKVGWKAAQIGQLCRLEKGRTPIQKATPGQYPLVVTASARRSSSEYQFDTAASCVPLVSSKGHGVASISKVYFQEGKFALGNILCAIIPNDFHELSAEFITYFLQSRKDFLLVPLMRGGANVSLTVDSLRKLTICFPPRDEQDRIVSALKAMEALIDDQAYSLPTELSARRQQYEYYRDKLLTFKELEPSL